MTRGHRWRLVEADYEPRLTKADWRLLYDQVKALREYWWRRLQLPETERQEVDAAWRSSI